MTRWLVTGAGGMLAHDLLAVLSARPDDRVVAADRGALDITDVPSVAAAVDGVDVVVNTAAWTRVDAAETEEAAATRVNGDGVAVLADACAHHGARLVHLSTDYVFDGRGTSPYPEDAPTAPTSAYGRSKLAGEEAVLVNLPEAGYVLRTAWLYGAAGGSFVRTMIRLEGSRDTVDVVDDQRGQPTWTADLARRIVELAVADAPPGVYHATNSGGTTWFGLAQAVFTELGADPGPAHHDRPLPAARAPAGVLRAGTRPLGPRGAAAAAPVARRPGRRLRDRRLHLVTRQRLAVAARWLLLVLVLVAFGVALHGKWADVREDLGRLDVPAVLLAALLCLLGTLGAAQSWREVLADLGSRVSLLAGARIFFVGQLGKYVPGAVWPVLVQMRLGALLGVPRVRMGLAFVVTLGLSLALGLVVGLAALPGLLAGAHPAYAWLLVLLPAALVFLQPRALNAVLVRALRLARRPPLEHALTGRGIARAGVGVMVFWLVGGLHVWVLAVDLGAAPWRTLPLAIGGFALAFCIGPLFVVLPAGAGVREAVLIVLLRAELSPTRAVAVALVSRFLLVVTDGLLALAAVAADRAVRPDHEGSGGLQRTEPS